MSLTLLDGTDATVDCNIVLSGTNTSSFRCVASALSFRSTRGYQDATTLCSGQDVSELPGRRQHFISIAKFASKGAAISDLSTLLSSTAPAAVNFVAYTGCTKTGNFWMDEDSMSVAAGQVAMPGSTSLRSAGGVATAWVVT